LKNVDVEQKLRQLDSLMQDDRLFENENLNLAMLADALDISSHQLSELINSTFGHGFSRYLRERRVAEASKLIADDPTRSILAISLMSGFRSQSNFYAAFREITGQSPGAFRKK
jgi:AraC-like DNA-binding protein